MGVLLPQNVNPNCSGTCETAMGCDCHPMHKPYTPPPTPDWVQGPTNWSAMDNPEEEQEQDMRPPKWLGWLLIAAILGLIWGAAP